MYTLVLETSVLMDPTKYDELPCEIIIDTPMPLRKPSVFRAT